MPASILIRDHGRLIELHYASLLEYHGDGALAGAAIGFQAMACAAARLSGARRVWDRRDLHVVSWHHGPGVRDAIEFVTRAVTRNRYTQHADGGSCARLDAFRFLLRERALEVSVALRPGVVSEEFFALASLPQRDAAQEIALVRLKAEVAERVITSPAERLFDVHMEAAVHA